MCVFCSPNTAGRLPQLAAGIPGRVGISTSLGGGGAALADPQVELLGFGDGVPEEPLGPKGEKRCRAYVCRLVVPSPPHPPAPFRSIF